MKIIKVVKGSNPCALFYKDNKIQLVLEEKKINFDSISAYPRESIRILIKIFEIDEPLIEQVHENILKTLPTQYCGMEYNKEYIYGLVINEKLLYKKYIHDPKNPKFTTPQQFFEEVSEFMRKGYKVGWFQGRWRIGYINDLNRCILTKRIFNIPKIVDKEMGKNALFMRLVKLIGIPVTSPLNAYNPIQAIKKLKESIIDVLVIGNLIVTDKKEVFENV